jgi:hypothetical protein
VAPDRRDRLVNQRRLDAEPDPAEADREGADGDPQPPAPSADVSGPATPPVDPGPFDSAALLRERQLSWLAERARFEQRTAARSRRGPDGDAPADEAPATG